MMKMEWDRGQTVGRGRFGTVSLATPRNNSSKFPPLMVVKSCSLSNSESLRTEKETLLELGDHCPEIVRYLGYQVTPENGDYVCNLFLEYASNGSLSDHLKNSGGKFEVSDVKKYTKSILKGLCHIHDKGYVHCDIKLDNILVFANGSIKIADFGLAKQVSEKKKYQLRGTPLYMSPELIVTGNGGPPADIWALGCSVVEMISGKPAWNFSPECDVSAVIYRIGMSKEMPEIPANLCSQGRDFVEKCFVRDPNERWTARMLLDHPFVSGGFDDGKDQQPSASPRGPFELFSDCESEAPTPNPAGCSSRPSVFEFQEERESLGSDSDWVRVRVGASSRLEQLVSEDGVPNWCDSDDGWIIVR